MYSDAEILMTDERLLGKIETTMNHFGASLEEAKEMIKASSEATGELRVEVARGLTRVQEKQAAQETEVNRRFGVVDDRLDKTNLKVDGIRVDLADHERLELAGDAHAAGGGNGKPAAVGVAGAGGAVGIWWIVQKMLELFSSGPSSSGGH